MIGLMCKVHFSKADSQMVMNNISSEKDLVLQMSVPIYETKQVVACFYKARVEKMTNRKHERSKGRCLYSIWKDGRQAVMLSWVDGIAALGYPEDVKQIRCDLESTFVFKSEGELKEYAGSKIDIKRKSNGLVMIRSIQPVLIQKLEDEFDIPSG